MRLRSAGLPLIVDFGLLLAPLAAEAQQQAGKVWRIGLFHVGLDHVPPSRQVRQVAAALKFQALERDARNQTDIERVFASVSRGTMDGVFIASLNLRVKFHSLILHLASARQLPVAGHRKEWVEQGALFSYAESIREVGRAAAASYVDKIFKGARPGDLPVEAYERPELVINLKTAKTLGLTIPPSLLGRAGEVIQ